ncbi:MAG: hypothetical protein DCC67_04660 [Planctomycetota bacterium]|nr:MAG: hypothetical protein DCC67_04660 [Planctomycetota bacterium]
MNPKLLQHLLCVAAIGMPAAAVYSEPPTPTDPGGLAQGLLPGAFPTSVTAANVNVAQFTPATLDGSNSNNLQVTFTAAGPIKWTESRHNEGDISLLISPGEPGNSAYYPPAAFVNDYKPLDGQPFQESTIAWRLNQQAGAALATVRKNSFNYGPDYTFNGSPVGTFHGTAYFNGSGSGYGYRMNDGAFNNGGSGSSDLQMGMAGDDGGRGEASFSTAVAFFPYEQGWTGAWVNGGFEEEATFAASSPGLSPSSVNWVFDAASGANLGRVVLPNIDSADDGMLFVAPTHDGNATNFAAALPTGGGWDVVVREDDSSQLLTIGADSGFQFLYVPYTAGGLIGGHINGANGNSIHAAGENLFDVVRNSAGQYAVSVYKPDGVTKRTENDGMLILTVADSLAANATVPDDAFLSYEYDAGSGDFIIQARSLTSASGGTENQFGNVFTLRDADFYFAWVDFATPLTPNAAHIPGDFDGDQQVDGADLTTWQGAVGASAQGDADGDGDSDGHDFLIWQRNFGTGAAEVAGVPEATSLLLLAAGGALAATRRRRASRGVV